MILHPLKNENVPTLQELIDGFEKLEQLNLEKSSYEDIKAIFFQHIPFLPSLISPKNDQVQGPFFRIRTDIGRDENLESVSTFSMPPSEKTKKLRANIEKHPVFYCSPFYGTAIQEIPNYLGKILYVGKWQWITPRLVDTIQFIFDADKGFDSTWSEYTQTILDRIKKLDNCHVTDKEKLEAMSFLQVKLGNLFVSNNYHLSSFIAHNYLYDSKINIDVIIYPSISDKTGFNYAIGSRIVPCLKLEQVIKIQVNSVSDDDFQMSVYQVGIVDGELIKWRNATEEDMKNFF